MYGVAETNWRGLQRAPVSRLNLDPVREACVESDYVLHALLSGLGVIDAKTPSTHLPAELQRSSACRQAWIHVPSSALVD